MSKEALELLERIEKAPVSVQREISARLLEKEIGFGFSAPPGPVGIGEIAGRFKPVAIGDLKAHDQNFVEAIMASKFAESPQ